MSKLENEIIKNSDLLKENKLLDLFHISFGKYFKSIVKIGKLTPRKCDIFQDELLYFSYGAPFYKPENMQTENALEFPIAFMFKIEAFKTAIDFFPFDTGCIYSSKIAGISKEDFEPSCDYCVQNKPENLVSCFYDSNKNYLKGIVRNEHSPEGHIINKIKSFLSTDFSFQGMDNRQRTIECIYKDDIDVLSNMIWIAYPDFLTKTIANLWKKSKIGFDYYAYTTDTNENPAHLATYISKKAKEIFKFKYQRP